MLEHNARAFSLQSRHLRHSADAVPTRTNGEQNSNEKNLSKTPEKHNSLLTFMKKKKQDTESRLPADFVTPKLENLTIDILIETLKADTRYCIRTSSKVKRTALSEKPWIELNRYTKKVRIFYRVLTTIQEFGETDQSGDNLRKKLVENFQKDEPQFLFKTKLLKDNRDNLQSNLKLSKRLTQDIKTWEQTLSKYFSQEENKDVQVLQENLNGQIVGTKKALEDTVEEINFFQGLIDRLTGETEEMDLFLHEMLSVLQKMFDLDDQINREVYVAPEIPLKVPNYVETPLYKFSKKTNEEYLENECDGYFSILPKHIRNLKSLNYVTTPTLVKYWKENVLIKSLSEDEILSVRILKKPWSELKEDKIFSTYVFLQSGLFKIDSEELPLDELFVTWKNDICKHELTWYGRHRKCYYEKLHLGETNYTPNFLEELAWCDKEYTMLVAGVERLCEIAALENTLKAK